MALAVSLLAVLGLIGLQFAGLGVTEWKVEHAAQMAAYTAASLPPAVASDQTPCWAVTGGMRDPARYGDSVICRTVIAYLGDLDPDLATVSVSPSNPQHRTPDSGVHVSVTYRLPVTSPVVRWVIGSTFTATAEATSWTR